MNSGAKVVVNGVETNLVTSLADLSLGTACVGTYKPNAFGLYDMLGNVEELCLDTQLENPQLKAYYYSKAEDGTYIGIDTPVVDPVGAPRDYAKEVYGKLRCVTRGGSWSRSTTYCNLWEIISHEAANRSWVKGFRFVITCEK
jgi:formylglycine-generating enzyme required for sulfatase activity